MGNEGNQFKYVGTRPVRPDGVDKVTGQANYGADFTLPGMLVGRVLRSPHPHARIKSIDTSRAAALGGPFGGDECGFSESPVRSCGWGRSAGQLSPHLL